MTLAAQQDFFRSELLEPQQGVWCQARFVSWSYMQSPTQGPMRRLVGEILNGSGIGWAIWKPLTHDLTGVKWVERSLKSLGFPPYKFAALRRPGLGDYLDELCRALVHIGMVQVTLYPYTWAGDGSGPQVFWTVQKVKKA